MLLRAVLRSVILHDTPPLMLDLALNDLLRVINLPVSEMRFVLNFDDGGNLERWLFECFELLPIVFGCLVCVMPDLSMLGVYFCERDVYDLSVRLGVSFPVFYDEVCASIRVCLRAPSL